MPWNRKDYPTDWEEIRARILERADNRCEFCGVVNHSLVKRKTDKLTKIVLTIAHLDHDKENHKVTDDRLKALCQKCHLQLDMPHHVNNRKYGRNHLKNQNKLF